MRDIAYIVLPFLAFLSAWLWLLRWQYRTAEARLRSWAEGSHFTLLEQHKANPPGTGPMARNASNTQVMYRVVVATAAGVRRRALVKIGSPTIGVLSKELSVEWEDSAN